VWVIHLFCRLGLPAWLTQLHYVKRNDHLWHQRLFIVSSAGRWRWLVWSLEWGEQATSEGNHKCAFELISVFRWHPSLRRLRLEYLVLSPDLKVWSYWQWCPVVYYWTNCRSWSLQVPYQKKIGKIVVLARSSHLIIIMNLIITLTMTPFNYNYEFNYNFDDDMNRVVRWICQHK
jgi:hypothetical protein